MHAPGLDTAIELTAAMWAAADAEDWDTVAALAGARHAALETALAGGAARLEADAIDQLRGILDADRQLAERASAARQQTAAALRDLRGGQRMHNAYATQAMAG
jgi:hypothetical protein